MNVKFNNYYSYWILFHSAYVLFIYLMRIAFENQKPPYIMVVFDFYLDFVFFIDLIREFTQPFPNDNGKFVYNKK